MKGFKTYFTFLSRNKLFTVVNVAGLAISIMFILLIGNMVTRQLTVDADVPDADRIYIFSDGEKMWGHYQIGLHFKEMYPEVEDWSAFGSTRQLQCDFNDDKPFLLTTAFVKSNFFEFFGYNVINGNEKEFLIPENNIVLTRKAALRLFGTEAAIGKTIHIERIGENHSFVVAGIVDEIDNSIFDSDIEAFLPIVQIKYVNGACDIDNTDMTNAASASIFLKYIEGFDPATRHDEMLQFIKEFHWMYKYDYATDIKMVSMRDFYFSGISAWIDGFCQYNYTQVIVFMITGIIILLMAVFNYMSISVAQTSYRAKEMATRRLLGSSPNDVFWRMIIESLAMTAVAFAIGLVLAKAAEPYAMELLGTKLDVAGDIDLLTVVCWVLFIALLSFVAGFVPASILSHYNPLDVVKGTFRRKTKMSYLRVLNVVQCGLTTTLLACTIYFGLQIYGVLNAPLGYNYGNVLDYPYSLDHNKMLTFREEALKLPFVKNVSFAQGTPIDGGNNMTTKIAAADTSAMFSMQFFRADSAFLRIFDIKVSEDRKLANMNNAFYLSENTMERYKKLNLGTDRLKWDEEASYDIAGQFKDFQIKSLLFDPEPTMGILIQLLPPEYIWPWNILVEVVTEGDREDYRKQLDKLYYATTGNTLYESEWYDQENREQYDEVIKLRNIVTIFTAAALLISLLGLTAMSVYMVSQRKRDIAIRKVFSSTSIGEQFRLLKFSSLSLLISLVIAIPLTIVGFKEIYDFVPFGGISTWWIPIAAFIIVSVISLTAVWLIGRNATQDNPINNIKTE